MESRSVLFGTLTSRITGDHAYRFGEKVGDRLVLHDLARKQAQR